MAQCVEAWQQGGNAAVEAVLAQHPALAGRLRERLAKLERAGLLGPTDDAPAEIPEQLGEFKLLKRLGSGGMGVVFLAEQLTLGRTVALKLVRPEQRFFPGARERFRREVEAVARLGDAGIVPIYSVGTDQGIDFFAMEYVRGASLGDALAAVHGTPVAQLAGRDLAVVAAARAETPLPSQLAEVFAGTWVQACCRVVARMARAAHHAHERGVVHRDLKPNNTMVTPDGRVLLLDFGLAAASGAARITRSGAQLGTLHYMAPEQLLDGAVDARTDVYALGVTLHELLALRSPFHAESAEGLRQQILHGTAAPLLTANPEVPRDVQTLVAVAMDRDPARRFASAQAFADDLERFLQHRPIQARPIGVWLRSVRWSQRHPTLATAGALLLTAAMATPFLIRWTRGHAEAQLAEAKEQARGNLRSAITAVEGMLAGSRAAVLTRTPGLDEERRRRIDEATTLVTRLYRENRDDHTVQTLFLRAMVRIADFRRLLGDLPTALTHVEAAEAALAAAMAKAPQEHAADQTAVQLARASILVEQGQTAAAAALWQTIADAHANTEAASMPTELRLTLATSHNNLGRMAHANGELAVAQRHLERCLTIEDSLPQDDLSVDRIADRVHTQMNLATVLRDRGDRDGARDRYEMVRQRLQAADARLPGEPELRREGARVDAALGALRAERKDYAGAVPLRARAVATMQDLAEKFPDRLPYQQELAEMGYDLSTDQQMAGDLPSAEQTVRRAITVAEQVTARAPDNLEHPTQLARCLRQLSGLQYRTDRQDEATKTLSRAIELQEDVVRRGPEDPHYHLQAAGLSQEIALHHANREQWQPAREALHRSRDHYEFAMQKGHAPARDPRRFPQLLMVLSQMEMMCDDSEGVVRALQRLQQVRPMAAAQLRQVGGQLHVDDRADFAELLRTTEAAEAKARDAKK